MHGLRHAFPHGLLEGPFRFRASHGYVSALLFVSISLSNNEVWLHLIPFLFPPSTTTHTRISYQRLKIFFPLVRVGVSVAARIDGSLLSPHRWGGQGSSVKKTTFPNVAF